MRFFFRDNLYGWEGWTTMDLSAPDITTAGSELAYVGLVLGRDGLVLVG